MQIHNPQRYVKNSKHFIKILTVCVIILVTFIGIVYTSANDGGMWIDAGGKFFDALERKDFLATHYSSRFGVSVMWLYGVAKLFSSITPFSLEQMLTTIIFILTTAGIMLFVKKLKTLSGPLFPSFTVLSYLLLAPYVVSSPLYVTWLDKILTISVPLCIVFWTDYLMGEHKQRSVAWAGICMGIAFLTKPAGIILVPLLSVMTGFIIWKDHSFRAIKPLILVFAIAGIMFVTLYPAMWVNPLGVLFSRIDSPEAHLELTIPFFANNSFSLILETLSKYFLQIYY